MAVPATIRGHQATFKIFQDGEEVVIDSITRVSLSEESTLSRHMYVGNATPQTDKTNMGWTGSFEMEVRDATVERLFDRIISQSKLGVGQQNYSFVIREHYTDGTVSAYVYPDCQFKIAREQSGLENKITKTIEFIAGTRARVA